MPNKFLINQGGICHESAIWTPIVFFVYRHVKKEWNKEWLLRLIWDPNEIPQIPVFIKLRFQCTLHRRATVDR